MPAPLCSISPIPAVVGAAVAAAVSIPVIGGFGGARGWMGMRMAHAAVGIPASNLDSRIEKLANVANIVFDAMAAYVEIVRAGRQIKGAAPAKAAP